MRKFVAPILCSLAIVGASLVGGCKFTMTAGTEDPAPAETATAAPTPTPTQTQAKKPPMLNRKIRLIGNKVELPGPVTFQTGTAILAPEAEPVLDVVRQFMEQNPNVNILRIEGHTDSDGEDAANMDLSKRRALACGAWLVAKSVDCKRLLAVGFGETQPVASNSNEEGKAQNRRVDFIVASKDGKPVTDDKGKPLPVDGGGSGQNAGVTCP